MNKYNIIEILKKTNALVTDSHIVLTSGRHTSVYINKDAIYPHTKEASLIGEIFAQKFKNFDMDAVAGPAIGGIILSQWTAYHLSKLKKKEIVGVYTEKNLEKNQIFTRGYERFINGKNVLVVEDVTTTGGSVMKLINSVRAHGGNIIAVGVMINRDPERVTSESLDAPFYPLETLFSEDYDEKSCPLCKKNVPLNTSVGHGKQFLEDKHDSLALSSKIA